MNGLPTQQQNGMLGIPPQQNGQVQQPVADVQHPVQPSKQPMGKDYQMYVARGLELISSQQTSASILQMLKTGDPMNALARTLVVIMQKLDAAARQKGIDIPDMVKIYGSHELLQALVEVGQAAKILNIDKDVVELAYSVAVQNYIKSEINGGRINPAKLHMQTQSSMKKIPPQKQHEIQATVQRIQETAKRYSASQGQQEGGQP